MTPNPRQGPTSATTTPAFTTPATTYELHRLTPRDHRAWHEGYYWGLVHGMAEGRRQGEADMAAAWKPLAQFVRRVSTHPTHAQLCDRRDEPDRADRARRHQARLGLPEAS